MGKALMALGWNAANVSGSEQNLFGSATATTTEANTQYSATEGADFTGLRGVIVSGGSGTNTVRFRDAGAAGQNVISRIGAGSAEDTTHTDTLTASDLFNIAFTDTGTDPVWSWVAANVAMASGHGNFHGCAGFGGRVFNVASATRFIPISGGLDIDGNATEARVQWKNRGYTSIEAFQIRVTVNARTNDSVFRVRVNGVNQGTAITYAAAATGLQSVTGMGITLADGDLVCISCTLLTGVENLTVSFVGMTLKSTGLHSETIAANQTGVARAASATATYYVPGGNIVSPTEANARIKPGFAARCRNLRCYLSANTYTGNGTLKLMVNGVAQITTTITASGGAAWYENTTDSFDIDDNDEISFEIDEGTSGSITIQSIGVTLGAIPAPVTGLGLHHIGEGMGDTGEGARVPQTLHTIEQGIMCELREAA